MTNTDGCIPAYQIWMDALTMHPDVASEGTHSWALNVRHSDGRGVRVRTAGLGLWLHLMTVRREVGSDDVWVLAGVEVSDSNENQGVKLEVRDIRMVRTTVPAHTSCVVRR